MTSFQDRGRLGSQCFGVSRSGAMDLLGLACANLLVGNDPDLAAIECMLAGATFVVDGTFRVARAGAPGTLTIDGAAVPVGSSATATSGQTVTVGPARAGIFAYLAVAGGLDVPAELGSLSLQSRAGIGGFCGRALRAGDRIPLRAVEATGPELSLALPALDRDRRIRVVLGPQADHFDDAAIEAFLSSTYRVSPEADRMGYRLLGPAIPHLRGFNIISDGLVAGSVQVPGSGTPIVMMADHQTTGGYPKIATVISADLRVLAQRRAGEGVTFEAVTVEVAQAAARQEAAAIAGLQPRPMAVRRSIMDAETLLALNLAGEVTDALAADP